MFDIINYLSRQDFQNLKGSKLHFEVVLTKSKLNEVLKMVEEDMEQIDLLEIETITDGKLHLRLSFAEVDLRVADFELINRLLVLHPDPNIQLPETVLKLKVDKGVGFIENELIELLFNTLLKNDAFDFENKTMLLNHKNMLDDKLMINIMNHITKAKVEVLDEAVKYIIDLKF